MFIVHFFTESLKSTVTVIYSPHVSFVQLLKFSFRYWYIFEVYIKYTDLKYWVTFNLLILRTMGVVIITMCSKL